MDPGDGCIFDDGVNLALDVICRPLKLDVYPCALENSEAITGIGTCFLGCWDAVSWVRSDIVFAEICDQLRDDVLFGS